MSGEPDPRIYYARLICSKIIVPIICTIGAFINAINIIVLTRSWMKSSTNVYLTAVSISDLTYLFTTFLYYLHIHEIVLTSYIYMHIAMVSRQIANVVSNITTWLTVAFTIERFINISYPIFGHRYCTRGKAKRIVLGVYISAFFVTFPDFFKSKVTKRNNDTYPVKYALEESSYAKEIDKYGYVFINQFAFIVLPFILLAIFNSLLIKKGLEAKRTRDKMSKYSKDCKNYKYSFTESDGERRDIKSGFQKTRNNSTRKAVFSEQQRITVMLIAIVVSFLILQAPSAIIQITLTVVNDNVKSDKEFLSLLTLFGNISNVLLTINATLNFVFYSLFSIKFRLTCKKLFPKMLCFGKKGKAKCHGFNSEKSNVNKFSEIRTDGFEKTHAIEASQLARSSSSCDQIENADFHEEVG